MFTANLNKVIKCQWQQIFGTLKTGMEITFTPFLSFVGLRNFSSPGAEWKGTLSASCNMCCKHCLLPGLLIQKLYSSFWDVLHIGHIWVGRRCRWIHKEEPSFWTSMSTYLSLYMNTFMFMNTFMCMIRNNITVIWQEEISGWREDLFTARKSAMNLLGVIAMSKVKNYG